MVNYQLGKVYKIVCRITGEVYVGSTCEKTLAKRLVAHRADYNRFCENNPKGSVSSSQIISRGDYYIDLLEAYPCNSSDELRKKEREYYDKIDCINQIRPYITSDELKAYHYEKQKKFMEENRELYNERRRTYYHKVKKIPTEEEIEARKLKLQELINYALRKKREKYEAKLAENPNYVEEMKARRKEQKKINNQNYIKRQREAKKKAKEEEKDTI